MRWAILKWPYDISLTLALSTLSFPLTLILFFPLTYDGLLSYTPFLFLPTALVLSLIVLVGYYSSYPWFLSSIALFDLLFPLPMCCIIDSILEIEPHLLWHEMKLLLSCHLRRATGCLKSSDAMGNQWGLW